MSSRSALATALVVLLLMLGAGLLLNSNTSNISGALRSSQLRETMRQIPAVGKPSEISDALASQLVYYLKLLAESKEVLLYGGIAFFGVLMMILAIKSASATPKDNTQAMLELLKQEKEKAENLAKLKSEFLNQVSHELRTPLAVITGYVECMTDGLYGQVEAKHQEILEIVSKQSSHLKNMIDQILIFSRLEASRQPIRIEDVSIHKIVSDLKDTFDFLCRQKGLGLTWDIPARLPALRSDSGRINEVISNLLQNAIKYTDRGSISVRVREHKATDSVVIEVTDTGIGIPEHSLQTIFEPFTQVHKTSTENSRGGIGLGLSIVKKHIEQIKGTITVESELGRGSTFKVILPRLFREKKSRGKHLLGLIKLSLLHSRAKADPPAVGSITGARKASHTSHTAG